MKNIYVAPELEINRLSSEDIILKSDVLIDGDELYKD